jgi:hypothetical protein
MFVDTIDTETAATIVEHLRASDAPMRVVAQLRALGGAMARVPADATAFAHRRSPIMVIVAAVYQDPDQAATHHRWVTDLAAALHQGDTGAYVGFIGEEGATRVRDAYPQPTWQGWQRSNADTTPPTCFTSTRTSHPRAWQGVDQPGKRPSTP